MSVETKFRSLLGLAKSQFDAGESTCDFEESFVQVLKFIKMRPDSASIFKEVFSDSINRLSDDIPCDLIEFCMRDLKWPEIYKVVKDKIAIVSDPRPKSALGHILEVYDQDWDGDLLYKYFKNSKWEMITDAPTANGRVAAISKAAYLKDKEAIPYIARALTDYSIFTNDEGEPLAFGHPVCEAALKTLCDLSAVEAAPAIREFNQSTNNRLLKRNSYIALVNFGAISIDQVREEMSFSVEAQISYLDVCGFCGKLEELERMANSATAPQLRTTAKNVLADFAINTLNSEESSPERKECVKNLLRRNGIKFRKYFIDDRYRRYESLFSSWFLE